MLKLKYSNIRNGEICFMRSKTVRTSKIEKETCAVPTPVLKIHDEVKDYEQLVKEQAEKIEKERLGTEQN
ncbi:hypothetical protein [Sunxiuqinia indica]|uniref:hypothetical protein n=1 Tax=Sunxiuqinia indica TaxID=2692584 RepID=UPI00135745FF|nr:hypothetical protein [Sunxiuqinia indica]